MSTAELIEKIKTLPPSKRAQVAAFVAQLDASAERRRGEQEDRAIINRRSARLNREAADVLEYQVSL